MLMVMFRGATVTLRPDHQGYPSEPKTIGEHLKKRRMDLGLHQAKVARQIGVSFDHETETFGRKIRRHKYTHGLSNKRLANLLGVDEGTVAGWERSERKPLKRSMEVVLSVVNKTAAH